MNFDQNNKSEYENKHHAASFNAESSYPKPYQLPNPPPEWLRSNIKNNPDKSSIFIPIDNKLGKLSVKSYDQNEKDEKTKQVFDGFCNEASLGKFSPNTQNRIIKEGLEGILGFKLRSVSGSRSPLGKKCSSSGFIRKSSNNFIIPIGR